MRFLTNLHIFLNALTIKFPQINYGLNYWRFWFSKKQQLQNEDLLFFFSSFILKDTNFDHKTTEKGRDLRSFFHLVFRT